MVDRPYDERDLFEDANSLKPDKDDLRRWLPQVHDDDFYHLAKPHPFTEEELEVQPKEPGSSSYGVAATALIKTKVLGDVDDIQNVCRIRLCQRIHSATGVVDTWYGCTMDSELLNTMMRGKAVVHKVLTEDPKTGKEITAPHSVCNPKAKSNPLPNLRFYNNNRKFESVIKPDGEEGWRDLGPGAGYGSSSSIFSFALSKPEIYMVALSDQGNSEATMCHARYHQDLDEAELKLEKLKLQEAKPNRKSDRGRIAEAERMVEECRENLTDHIDDLRALAKKLPEGGNASVPGYFFVHRSQKGMLILIACALAAVRCHICCTSKKLQFSLKELRWLYMRFSSHSIPEKLIPLLDRVKRGDLNLGRDFCMGPIQIQGKMVVHMDNEYAAALIENDLMRERKKKEREDANLLRANITRMRKEAKDATAAAEAAEAEKKAAYERQKQVRNQARMKAATDAASRKKDQSSRRSRSRSPRSPTKNLGRDWAVGPLQAYKNINTISIDDRDYKTILAENKKTRAAKAKKEKVKEKKKADETSSARAPRSPRHRSASLDSTQPIERQHVTQKRRRQSTFENDENIRPVKRSLLQDDSSRLLTLAQTSKFTLPMKLHNDGFEMHDNTPPLYNMDNRRDAAMLHAPVASHSARPDKIEVDVADSSNQVQRLCLSNIGSLQANCDNILETSSTQAVEKPTNAVVKTKEEMHISSNNMPSQVQPSQSATFTMLNEDFMSPAVETDFPTHLIKPIISIEVFADQTPEGVKSETEMQVASYNSIIAVQRSQSNSPTRLNRNVDFSRGYLLPPADLNDSPAQPTTTETKIEVTDHESMLAQKSCSRNSHSLVNDANGSLAIGTTQSSNRISLDHRPLSVVGYQLCEPATNFVVFWSQGGIADVGSLMLASSNRTLLVATESVDEICRRKNNTNVVLCTLETENSGHIKINVLTFGKKPLPFSSHMAYPIKDFESYINLYMRLNNATNLTHVTRYESDIGGKGLYQTLCKELSGNVIGTNCDMLIPSNDV